MAVKRTYIVKMNKLLALDAGRKIPVVTLKRIQMLILKIAKLMEENGLVLVQMRSYIKTIVLDAIMIRILWEKDQNAMLLKIMQNVLIQKMKLQWMNFLQVKKFVYQITSVH